MKVMVLIPIHGFSLGVETVRCLIHEVRAGLAVGVEVIPYFLPGQSLITHARNQLVRDFIRSDADRAVFVDADVAWDPGDVIKLASRPQDVVGGAYRLKADRWDFPVFHVEGGPVVDPDTGLIEVAALPGGFMALSRKVFDTLFASQVAENKRGYSFAGETFWAFFHAPYGDGEDGTFCKEWRELGGKVWLDPDLTLSHVDPAGRKYTGCIGAWMKAKGMLKQPEAAEAA